MKTHLFFGLLTLVLLTIIIGTRRREAFGFDDVIDLAQAIAAGRSLSAAPALPKELKELNYDQHRDIRWKDQYTLWRREGLPFQVRFVHPGYIFDRPVDIFYEVSNSSFERLRYSPVFFDFGRNVFRARFPDTHVKAVIFFRKKVEHAGYAPITSMYWFGENTSNTFGDFRPEVHDSDGLLVHRNNGEWVWHPLAWSKQLQLNVFADDHPKGYGLLQRDRDFNHYQDLEALYHKRPSVWVQALNGFDNGAARLVQLPTKDEFQDNVVAFWTPAEPPPLLKPIELEYMLRWFGDSEDLPPLGRCVLTRVDDQDKPYYRHFFAEFWGGPLAKLKPGEIPTAEVASPTGAGIADVKVEWNDFNKTWRISFYASTPEDNKPNELSCRLLWSGEVLTETWTYTWMP